MKRRRATVIVQLGDGILLAADKSGLILLPGGGVDAGELPIAAAARELHEETGLVAHQLRYLFSYESRSNQHYVFEAEAEGVPAAGDDAEELLLLKEAADLSVLPLSPATRAILARFQSEELGKKPFAIG